MSTHNARPFDIAWARSMVQQCQAASVAVFVKQLGAKPREHYRDSYAYLEESSRRWPVDLRWAGVNTNLAVSSPDREDDWWAPVLKSRKGGDMGEFPLDLQVREFPHGR